jgi:crotonobetainyl-CoA:carnitine CoA-transferase CaiB-like acyl-CoA transferase
VLERLGLPYAPVNKPGDLFTDPHLNASGGLADIHLTDGRSARTPLLPVSMDGQRLQNRRDPPQIGQDTRDVLNEIGFSLSDVADLQRSGAIAMMAG